MEKNDVIQVADRLYREANPDGKMDTPSFVYEVVAASNVRRTQAKSELSLYDWCKEEMKKKKA